MSNLAAELILESMLEAENINEADVFGMVAFTSIERLVELMVIKATITANPLYADISKWKYWNKYDWMYLFNRALHRNRGQQTTCFNGCQIESYTLKHRDWMSLMRIHEFSEESGGYSFILANDLTEFLRERTTFTSGFISEDELPPYPVYILNKDAKNRLASNEYVETGIEFDTHETRAYLYWIEDIGKYGVVYQSSTIVP